MHCPCWHWEFLRFNPSSSFSETSLNCCGVSFGNISSIWMCNDTEEDKSVEFAVIWTLDTGMLVFP